MGSIAEIDSIPPKSATRLRKAGIRTTEGLLKKAATRKGRTDLSTETGFPAEQILRWVNRADLMRVKGIGSEYADLLEAAGVDTVRELRRRNAKALTARMAEINEHKKLVKRLPTEGMVRGWIEHSAELEQLVRA